LELARAHQANSNPEIALALMDEVLERDPDNPRALTEKGAALLASERFEEGEALIRRAIARDPSNVNAGFQLYLFLCGQPGRERERDAQFEIFKRLDDDRRRLGQILSKDMSKSPEDPNLLYELAMIFYRNGKTESGLLWLRRAYKLDPTHQPTLNALADHFKRVGDAENAAKYHRDSNHGAAK
jgi:Flp pilus assembly protein TadD